MPLDNLMARYQAEPGRYRGPWRCALELVRAEGPAVSAGDGPSSAFCPLAGVSLAVFPLVSASAFFWQSFFT